MIGAFKPRLLALLQKTQHEAAVRAMQAAQQQQPGAVPGSPAIPQSGAQPQPAMASAARPPGY